MATTRDKLKAATSLSEVARLLDQKPSSLAYVLYKLPAVKKYTVFEIPKKSGGKRQITAPDKQLKSLQRSLARILTECRIEIDKKPPKRDSLSHGFKKHHSILTNSRPHVRRRYVLNLDIKDFFPSFNFGRVRGYFIKNNDFALNETVATVIAQIACFQNSLPQGSPCSPIISDLLAHILDVRLVNLAKKYGCTYSRYADDLTFSTNQKKFPEALAFPNKKEPTKWELGTELIGKISNSGFSINPDKTRMQYAGSRQVVTGLVVNKKVNIKSGYYRIARSMCRALFKEGKYKFKGLPSITDLAPLQGQLSHIFHIKFSEVERQTAPYQMADNSKKAQRRDSSNKLVGWQKLYSRFIFYKNFVAIDRPIVICEGATDSIYLKAALQSAKVKFPSLITATGAGTKLLFSFFRYNKYSELLLRLGGGSDTQKNFIAQYAEELKLLTTPR